MIDQIPLEDAAERASQYDSKFNLAAILQTLLTNNALNKVTK